MFERYDGQGRFWVAINFSSESIVLEQLELEGQILLSTHLNRQEQICKRIELRTDEAMLMQLN